MALNQGWQGPETSTPLSHISPSPVSIHHHGLAPTNLSRRSTESYQSQLGSRSLHDHIIIVFKWPVMACRFRLLVYTKLRYLQYLDPNPQT